MDQMADLQTKFSRALLDPARPIPSAIRGATRCKADRRFAVYRNNVAAGLIDALAQRFPVVRRLVGDAFFEAMARGYVVTCPPASPIMLLYGESFPDFVENFNRRRICLTSRMLRGLRSLEATLITRRMPCPWKRGHFRVCHQNSLPVCVSIFIHRSRSSSLDIRSYRSGG